LSAVDFLALQYDASREALIHSDLHPGNLMVSPTSLFLIDWEFACMGPMSYDLGTMFGNLLLAYYSMPASGR
jgi:5-methylthioribose kinase